MTRLLVSVRSAEEAMAARLGGADLIDIKEPALGSLGAASAEVWSDVGEAIADRPLSVAMGELLSADTHERFMRLREFNCFRYAKVGLAGCLAGTDWMERWRQLAELLPSPTRMVAVAYADHRHAQSPSPVDLLQFATAHRCAAILIDTHDKTKGNLLDFMPVAELTPFVEQAKRAGLLTVLAGSLQEDGIHVVCRAAPDFVAVRGAVCQGERTAGIEEGLVRRLANILNTVEYSHGA